MPQAGARSNETRETAEKFDIFPDIVNENEFYIRAKERAGNHRAMMARLLFHQRMFDWLDGVLADAPSQGGCLTLSLSFSGLRH
jgi:hypothetical protein